MRRAVVFLALIFTLSGKALPQRVEVIDGIAAIVNNDVVTISQVRDLIGARERSWRRAQWQRAIARVREAPAERTPEA